ncbi:hypothetical protein NZK35_28915 [Stieleria sp. ICT_E10.1]|uniref:hypothetical protein n=1 Tax=Stieleria sedimenti TaxID=2976331 RepID=UPI00217F4621|nr:hypothetical protein [Stieleria sedimenti]MCS7470693.1 hypothetical protein [Stieleria sedimenti]
MTISRSLRKRLRRYALLCLVTATTAGFLETSQTSVAEDTHDSSDLRGWVEDLSQSSFSQESVAIRKLASQAPTPQFLTVSAEDQLTIDTCNFDTWLAGILPPSDSKPSDTPTNIEPQTSDLANSNASRTSSQFNSTLATIAAAASAGNPIPLSQWTEPFAMIGPDGSHTPQEIKAFQAWFDNGKAFVAGLGNGDFNGFIPLVDFDGKVAGPTNQSVAVPDSKPAQPVTVARPLIGSSPVIATIEEAYQPYDLAAEDLAAASQSSDLGTNDPEDKPAADKPQDRQIVWTDAMYSPSLQPFCIHTLDLMRKPGWSPLAQKTISSTEPVALSAEVDAAAEVEQIEPTLELETLVADAAVEAPAEAEPVQEEVVAEVSQVEPPVEAKTLVADAAVEAPADAEPVQEEVAAEVAQVEPPVEAKTLVADAAVEAPADAEPVQEEAAAEVAEVEPPVEAETLVADAAVEAPAEAEPVQEEVVAEVAQVEPPVEAKTLVADAAVEAPAEAEPVQEEVAAEVAQVEPPVEAETLVADAAVEAPAEAEPLQEEVVAEVAQLEPPVEAKTLVADAAVEAPADAEPVQEEAVVEVEQPEPQAESMKLVVANPSLPQAEVNVDEVPGYVGSPDCLLEDVMWQVSVAMEDANVTDQWLRPKRVGKRLASLVVGGDRVATRVASELALVWPANAQPAKPIPGSGAKLLARAEAAEQLPAEGTAKPFTPEQLAQADAMFRQWVGVAQSVLDDLSDRLNDVTEVALHRGTQDDSNRR